MISLKFFTITESRHDLRELNVEFAFLVKQWLVFRSCQLNPRSEVFERRISVALV